MDILSYRGPAAFGGVSGALTRVLEGEEPGLNRWWYLHGTALANRTNQNTNLETVCRIPSRILAGHYRYCNNFLWPILHDLPEYASYCPEDRADYQRFNLSIACNIANANRRNLGGFFVHDYQFAGAPSVLASLSRLAVKLFWHIPWPVTVSQDNAPFLVEIAESMLAAQEIGFHTKEYAMNFMAFVDRYIPHYTVDIEGCTISLSAESFVTGRGAKEGGVTSVIAQPLGLDVHFWLQLSNTAKSQYILDSIHQPFVLSVDRADYTKGVLPRFDAIDRFFQLYPDWLEKVTFVQVCQPTRTGLPSFDKYWQQCKQRAQEVEDKWKRSAWSPIVWIEEPLDSEQLANLYGKAKAMLINPLRDGLNLTAKEFVTCSPAGVLVLSSRAGVSTELGQYALSVDPLSTEQIAQQVHVALTMPEEERLARLTGMKERINENNLASWWLKFVQNIDTSGVVGFPRSKTPRLQKAQVLLVK